MNKLVCVEYNTNLAARSEKAPLPLSGFIGETLESFLHTDKGNGSIPVRFPLLGPGARTSLLGNDRNNLDPYQLAVEGERIVPSELYILEKKVPVSLYTRVPMGEEESLFETPHYMSTYSGVAFLDLMSAFDSKYQHKWAWKTEQPNTGSCSANHRHIFVEARVYGIDAAVNTYNGSRFGGVAVEVIYKPQPTKEMLKQGIMVMRTCADLIMFSHSEEYISYIDGVQIRRESVPRGWAMERYSQFITPKEVVALGRFRDYNKKIKTAVKEVAKSKKETGVFKDSPPPGKTVKQWLQPNAANTLTSSWATSTTTGAK